MSRRRIGLGLVALLLALAARVTSAQTVVTPTSKLQWTEATTDLATAQSYLYKHYDDGAATGGVFSGVTCSGPVAPFSCVVPLPAFPAGTHTLKVSACLPPVCTVGSTESAPSTAVSFTVLGPATPTTLVIVADSAPPPPPPSAQTITLPPAGDTTLNIDTVVHAADPQVSLYTFPDATIANAILLKFDLSAIPLTATIQSATLTLTLVQSDPTADATYTSTAHRITRLAPVVAQATGATSDGVTAWTAVSGRTYPLAQNDISPPYDTEVLDKTNGPKNWTLTRMVQEWVSGAVPNLGLLLNSDPTVLKDRFRNFASSEYATGTARPTLKVVYTP